MKLEDSPVSDQCRLDSPVSDQWRLDSPVSDQWRLDSPVSDQWNWRNLFLVDVSERGSAVM